VSRYRRARAGLEPGARARRVSRADAALGAPHDPPANVRLGSEWAQLVEGPVL